MTVIDANLLLYAYDSTSSRHAQAAKWLTWLLESGETIGLPWLSACAFLRISTNPRITDRPLSAADALAILGKWLAQPGVFLLHPGPRHLELLSSLLTEHGATGPMVTDAALAAIAIENGALLASADQDFSRFSALRWINPLAPAR